MPRAFRLACAALALALLLAASPARAQEGELRVELAPSEVEMLAGGNATSLVTVTNEGARPLALRLVAEDVGAGISVSFSPSEFDLLPGASASAQAHVRGEEAGEWQATVVAREREAPMPNATAPPVRAGALLLARVREPEVTTPVEPEPAPPADDAPANETPGDAPAPEPAPDPEPEPAGFFTVNASALEIAVERHARAPFTVDATNPTLARVDVTLTLRLPLGWNGALEAPRLTLPPESTTPVRASVTPGRDARDALGSLEIVDGGTRRVVELRLRVVDPPAPPPEEPAAQVAPAPPEEEAAAPAPPVGEPAAAPLPSVRVEPARVAAPPGATAVLTIVVSNPTAGPLDVRLRVGVAPIEAALDAPTLVVPPGGEAVATAALALGADLALGTRYGGAVSIDVEGASPASFEVEVASAGAPVAPVEAGAGADARLLLALAAAGLGGAALAGASAWRRWPGLGLLALYARLAPRRALEHPRRAAMLDLLRAEPGLTLADLQRRLGLSNGVARHHVALLEAAGVVRSVPDGPLRRLWPVGVMVVATPSLRDRALETLRARGRMRASELAAALGVSKQALHYHVKRLQAEGLVVVERAGAEVVLAPAPARAAA